MSSASASSSPALHRGTALDACWRTTGRGARRYLKSSRSARRDRGAGEPTPPRPANAGYCGPRGTRFLDGPRPARHAGTANPSGAPQDFGSQHPGRLPKDSAFPGGPAAGREDGGDGSQTLLKQQRWSLPRRQGRSGSLTRTGSRVTASCSSRCCSTLQSGSASSSCAFFLGSTSSWSAARCQTASFAGSDWALREAQGWAGLGWRPCSHNCLRPQVRGADHVCGAGARGPAGGLWTPGSPREGPHFQPCDTFRPQHSQPAHQL